MKQGKTVAEQLQLLSARGLMIPNYDKAYQTLQNINYYTLTGYLFPFKNKETGRYLSNTTFDLAIERYYFDSELRSILLALVSEAEEMLKTRIAYHIALRHHDDPLIYTDINFWKNPQDYQRFMADFHKNITNNSQVPFVRHHIQHYRGQFPIWVAVNILTLGNIKYLYKNIPSKDRKEISRELNLSPATLDSWIDSLRILRNNLAHNMRLYGTTFARTPKWEKHHSYKPNTNKIFVHIVLLKVLLKSSPISSKNISRLISHISQSNEFINLTDLGFSSNWREVLIDSSEYNSFSNLVAKRVNASNH